MFEMNWPAARSVGNQHRRSEPAAGRSWEDDEHSAHAWTEKGRMCRVEKFSGVFGSAVDIWKVKQENWAKIGCRREKSCREEGDGSYKESQKKRRQRRREDPVLCCETRARKKCSESNTRSSVFAVVTVWRREVRCVSGHTH